MCAVVGALGSMVCSAAGVRQGLFGGRAEACAAEVRRKQTTGSEKQNGFAAGPPVSEEDAGGFFTTCYNFVTKSAKELYNLALY